jgi:K+-sensing histidine kinase KdpD
MRSPTPCCLVAREKNRGLWPGILAGLLSTLALDYYFIPPIYSFVVSPEYVPSLIVFVSSSLFISWLNGEQKRANADLAQENRDRQWAPPNLAGYQETLQKGSVEALEKGKELVDPRKE